MKHPDPDAPGLRLALACDGDLQHHDRPFGRLAVEYRDALTIRRTEAGAWVVTTS